VIYIAPVSEENQGISLLQTVLGQVISNISAQMCKIKYASAWTSYSR